MPRAESRLEVMQVCKLLQCVREKDTHQIQKLATSGVPYLINFNDADEGNTALCVAAVANNHDMIEYLLEMGAHPDVMDLKGRTAAMCATEYGNVKCLEKLLEAGANMDLVDLEGKGILFYCISDSNRHTQCLDLTLAHGADVNNIARNGTPVLLLACETASENEHMCLTLLEKGSNPNSKIEPPPPSADGKKKASKNDKTSMSGRTALMAACNSGSSTVVKALLMKGAEVNALDLRNNHAAHFAAMRGHLECLICMGGYGAQFDQCNSDNNTPIHLAAMAGHALCCKYLSQRGCNPKAKNNDGLTARLIAKEEGHKPATKELRKAEKTFGKTGKNNDPWALALYDWLMQRQERVLELLKEHDPEQVGTVPKGHFMDTIKGLEAPVLPEQLTQLAALHDKARNNRVDYNDFLAAKKWINKNFLMSAFQDKKKKKKKGKGGKKKGKFKLVMPICTNEAGPRTVGGGPPELYISRHKNFTDFGRFDRDHPPQHPLQDDSAWYLRHPDHTYININDAARVGDFESLKLALEKGVHVDTKDKYYKTPLMTASRAGYLDMVKFLLEKGASVNIHDNFKWTALHHACHSGQLDVVQTLTEKGGEIDAPTLNGGTPLTRAIETSREDVVRYLIHCGVKIQTENRKGMTPMDIAEAWADPRVLYIVQMKWDSLPPIDSKKGGKGGKQKKAGGGGKAKRRASAPGEKEDTAHRKMTRLMSMTMDDASKLLRKGSIWRAASLLASGTEEKEDITYIPLRAWSKQPTSKDLIHDREVRRQRFGWEVDFPDFQMPFHKNVSARLAALENE